MSDTITYIGTIVAEKCCACGVWFGMPDDFQRQRRRDHALFYCPNGHSQHYTGQTEEQKLRDKLAGMQSRLDQNYTALQEERRKVEHERKRAQGYQGALTKVKKRIGKGCCPCCQRHFENVERHMKTKHPEYATEAPR